ncbi:MAG: hypothetical protein BKP49_08580 [Treponema sp. CETP13]|nr:MAG: hypothetical protein BKP49_08580 [Treponema sp. CETP13]
METQLVEIHKEQLLIHTGMSSRSFAQSHMSETLHENGWIAKQTNVKTWEFSPYQFSEIEAIQSEKNAHEEMIVTGPAFEGVTLASLFNNKPTDSLNFNRLVEILEKLNSAIEASFLQDDITIVANGPLNIIVSNNNSFLFLPDTLFKRSLSALSSSDYSKYYGCYLNLALNNIKSEWRFSLACMVYYTFSGSLPYTELNSEKRAEDYYDQRFIPLEKILQIPQNNEIALQIVNTNLSQQAFIRRRATSKERNSSKTLKNGNRESKPFIQGSLHHLANTYKKLNFSQEQKTKIQQNVKKFAKYQENAIKRKRFVRKHLIAIIISIMMILILISIANSIIKGNLSKPTTQGMSASQVVETLYEGISTINIDKVESTGTTKAVKNFSESLSTIFVTQQMRVAYEHVTPYLTPQQWLNTTNPSDNAIYGLSHLKIIPKVKPETERKTQDLNTSLPSYIAEIGDKATFVATYYLINSNANHEYTVTFQKDTLYLEYLKRNNWKIVKIDREPERKLLIDNKQLESDIKAAFEQSTQKDKGAQIAERLIQKYPWIPDPQKVAISTKEITQTINLTQ